MLVPPFFSVSHLNRRGVSELVGIFLMTLIVMGIAAAWLTLEAPRISRESMGIVEALRAAARRQRQLLSLLYYYKTSESTPKLRIYIYNYGFEESTISGDKGIILAGSVVPREAVTMRDAESGASITDYKIKPKQTVEITFPSCPSGTFDLIIRTEEGGIFIWELKV